MAAKKVRIGVAGLGRIGWGEHCRRLSQHPAFTLTAVQDVLPERLAEAEREYRVKTFADFEEMLASGGLEAVVVATPTHLHKPMVIAALKAGLHVLVEKPIAVDATEGTAMLRAARRYDRVLTVYQSARSSAMFQTLRKLVNSGVIGTMYHARTGGFRYARRNDWQSLQKYGGGMLNNHGVHALDQLLQLCGYDVKRVFGYLRAVATVGDADDVARVFFETRSGVVGEADINQASVINPYRWIVWGTHGAISVRGDEWDFRVARFSPDQLPPRTVQRGLASEDRLYPSDDVAVTEERVPVDRTLGVSIHGNFAKAIRRGAELFVKPEESVAVMKVIDQCREGNGRVVRVWEGK